MSDALEVSFVVTIGDQLPVNVKIPYHLELAVAVGSDEFCRDIGVLAGEALAEWYAEHPAEWVA